MTFHFEGLGGCSVFGGLVFCGPPFKIRYVEFRCAPRRRVFCVCVSAVLGEWREQLTEVRLPGGLSEAEWGGQLRVGGRVSFFVVPWCCLRLSFYGDGLMYSQSILSRLGRSADFGCR